MMSDASEMTAKIIGMNIMLKYMVIINVHLIANLRLLNMNSKNNAIKNVHKILQKEKMMII